MKTLIEKIEDLSPEDQREIEDFVDFLREKRARRLKKKPTFSWAGALKELKDQYTSVELQHKVTDWWMGKE
ncbi:MAG: DUF2281 domain-containing protein [Candidatus Poribacteria bacterium]